MATANYELNCDPLVDDPPEIVAVGNRSANLKKDRLGSGKYKGSIANVFVTPINTVHVHVACSGRKGGKIEMSVKIGTKKISVHPIKRTIEKNWAIIQRSYQIT